MQISNSIGQGAYPDWESGGRSARPEFPTRVEGQAARRDPAPVPDGETFARQAVPASEAVPLLPPPTPASRPQLVDEALVRGRLMGRAGGSLSNRLAVAHYAAVAAQPERSHLAEVLGVDAYA